MTKIGKRKKFDAIMVRREHKSSVDKVTIFGVEEGEGCLRAGSDCANCAGCADCVQGVIKIHDRRTKNGFFSSHIFPHKCIREICNQSSVLKVNFALFPVCCSKFRSRRFPYG